MKFLLHGNSPYVATGYGVQIGQLAEQLRNQGHQVAISVTYGVQGSIVDWHGFRLYGCGFDAQSNDLLHGHAEHWFADTPRAECWIIPCIDVWGMVTPRLADYNVAAWTPVDHFPAPPDVLGFFGRTQAVPVAMSKFGERALFDAGLDPVYIPLSVDTTVFHPTPTVTSGTGHTMTGRELLGVPEEAFVVGMVAMNKGWAKDRKGFNEAFWAMGQFMRAHDDVVFYLHTEMWGGAEGQNLYELAIHAGIDDHRIVWAGGPGQYGYRVGYTPEMMAACYTAFDVLLAPSHGEGFCVPLIEAQACGTPVIATDFSAQSELVGAGWTVTGQPEWDPAQHAAYVCPFIDDILAKLHDAYDTTEKDKAELEASAVLFAAQYDTQRVFEEYWVPFLTQLATPQDQLEVTREPMPDLDAVAVLCPVKNRPWNVMPLVESFVANTPPGEAILYFIADPDDTAEIKAVETVADEGDNYGYCGLVISDRGPSYAQKMNVGYENTREPWVLLIGDDVRFHDGWLDHARKLSDRFDVIGTNDTAPGEQIKNPKVANGSHADHYFVRRAYVEEHGACLDGPGVLAPECYKHWYVDLEMIKLAKARGVFSPCLDSVVEHLHPGYDGREDLRAADKTYMAAVGWASEDLDTWNTRRPLVEMQRTTRGRHG